MQWVLPLLPDLLSWTAPLRDITQASRRLTKPCDFALGTTLRFRDHFCVCGPFCDDSFRWKCIFGQPFGFSRSSFGADLVGSYSKSRSILDNILTNTNGQRWAKVTEFLWTVEQRPLLKWNTDIKLCNMWGPYPSNSLIDCSLGSLSQK